MFNLLVGELNRQIRDYNLKGVEVLSECDNGQRSIGSKRNKLLDRASGEYLCFIDDDDSIDGEYLTKILTALENDPDCVQLIGVMSTDGFSLKRFEHSISHKSYYDYQGVYYRYPNHLNAIRSSIAKQFKFPETNFGEDTAWATQIRDSGLLQKEESIDKVIYHYLYVTRK